MESTGERYMPGYSDEVELEHLNRYYFVKEELDLKDKVVVDLASGEGYGSSLLANYAHYVYGIDISNEAIDHAKQKYKKENLEYIQGDAVKIPLLDNVADIFVSFETIEHHDRHSEMMQEIKRVLKPEGILIISSPDKYYYSDLPSFHNGFHVKELYYEEFKELLKVYFENIFFFSQRTFSGSIIALDEDSNQYKKPLIVETGGNSFVFTPIYNLAIASNSISYKPKLPMVFYKESEKMLTNYDILKAKDSIRLTKTYRLGSFIINPFRKIKHILKNV